MGSREMAIERRGEVGLDEGGEVVLGFEEGAAGRRPIRASNVLSAAWNAPRARNSRPRRPRGSARGERSASADNARLAARARGERRRTGLVGEKSPPEAGGVPGDANASPRRRFRATPREGRDVAEGGGEAATGDDRAVDPSSLGVRGTPNVSFASTTPRTEESHSAATAPASRSAGDSGSRVVHEKDISALSRGGMPPRRDGASWLSSSTPPTRSTHRLVPRSFAASNFVRSTVCPDATQRGAPRVARVPIVLSLPSRYSSSGATAPVNPPFGPSRSLAHLDSFTPSRRLHVRDSHHGGHKKPDRRETTVGGGDTAPQHPRLTFERDGEGTTVRA